MSEDQYDPESAYAAVQEKFPHNLPEWHGLSTALRTAFMEVYLSGAKHGTAKMEKAFLDKPKHDTPLREALSIISTMK